MRIAIVAPLCETVPPSKYGGTERVIHYIVEELVRLGHTVTLYAASGSKTSAKLIECYDGTFRDHGIVPGMAEIKDGNTVQLKLAMSDPTHDIIHVHHGIDPYHARILDITRPVPIVWTDHNAVHILDKPKDLIALAKLDIGLTALSESHRSTVPEAKWLTTIHHGLPVNMLTPREVTPTYLAFLGRISPEKGINSAIRISEAAGFELKVAAKIDKTDQTFYEEEVKPHLDACRVDFIGEISDEEKGPFLSGAIALVFPICWLEPFGLVMIEAMACGCPVVAFRMGSAPEVIEDGVTGFLVDTEEEAVEALRHIGMLDRKRIRQRFEERFTSTTMAKKYVDMYERVIKEANAAREAKELETAFAIQETKKAGKLYNQRVIKGVSTRETVVNTCNLDDITNITYRLTLK
ncbi:glycosyltransferase family 4 protein [Periconia macrospinosa]|uniref:Glycosyltransferase family 4 protein n=1 Tax=Periconia macrospinosa TaxID=97972 RepID=A0A2V1E9I7_9PLEO|nr:glycosyltransferase family 4 protein [Periconia macrospinosa]